MRRGDINSAAALSSISLTLGREAKCDVPRCLMITEQERGDGELGMLCAVCLVLVLIADSRVEKMTAIHEGRGDIAL